MFKRPTRPTVFYALGASVMIGETESPGTAWRIAAKQWLLENGLIQIV